jgi:hypothetical protein
MRVGSLVKHKRRGVLGLVTKIYDDFEVCYVKWSDKNFDTHDMRMRTHRIEVIHE